MGVHRLLSLMIYLALEVLVVISNDNLPYEEHNFTALTSLLLALDPTLSKFLTRQMIFIQVPITPSKPTLLYSESHLAVHLQTMHEYFIFHLVSISSNEFKVKETPLLHHKYSKSYSLDVYFMPVKIGIRTAYMFVVTDKEFYVYYLKGTAEMPELVVKELLIEYMSGTIGTGVLELENLSGESVTVYLENVFVIDKDRLDILKKETIISDKLLVLKTKKIIIEQQTTIEVPAVESTLKDPGDYYFTLELRVNTVIFNIPIHVKVAEHGLSCLNSLDLGILPIQNELFSFTLTCEVLTNEPINLENWSINGPEILKPIFLKADSMLLIGQLLITSFSEGTFSRSLLLKTNIGPISIFFSYLVIFNIISLDPKDLQINKPYSSTFILCFINKLNHEILIDNFQALSSEIGISAKDEFAGSNDRACFSALIRNDKKPNLSVKAQTNIGNLIFPLHLIDHMPIFLIKKSDEFSEIFGPVDFGIIGYGVSFNKTFGIRNPYKFPITVYSINSVPTVTIKFSSAVVINPQGTIELILHVKPEFSLFNPFKIQTSIGNFTLTIHMSVIPGSCKVKNTQFAEIMPRVYKEENIFVINTYTVPVKIVSLSVQGEYFSITQMVDEIPPSKQSVVGKISVLLLKHEKNRVDFKKSLTYGDMKIWNSYINNYEESYVSGEIFVVTNIGGVIKNTVFGTVKKPTLPIRMQSKLSTCQIYTICPIYILIHNPLDSPLAVHVQVAPDSFSKSLKNYECHKKKPEIVDDEFENLSAENPDSQSQECFFTNTEEIFAVKIANEKKINLNPITKGNEGILDKIINMVFDDNDKTGNDKNCCCDTEYDECNKICKTPQTLYINDKILTVLPPQTNKLLGPIFFNPTNLNYQNHMIIVRNNYTTLEMFPFTMNIGHSRLAITRKSSYYYSKTGYNLHRNSINKEETDISLKKKQKIYYREYSELQIEISPEDINRFFLSDSFLLSPSLFRTFELHNVGNLDIVIQNIFLDGYNCNTYGYNVNPCNIEFLIKPSEYINIEITYFLAQARANDANSLHILTETDTYIFPIEVITIDNTNINNYIYEWAEELYGIIISSVCALIITTLNYHFSQRSLRYKARSSKDETQFILQQYFCKNYSQPILFTSQPEIVVMPNIQTQEIAEKIITPILEIPKNEETAEDVVVKIKKRQKIKRRLLNVIQSSEAAKELKKKSQAQPEIIATNKLLVGKTQKALDLSHSNSLTENGERDIQSDDDFYIDCYKTSNLLFAGYNDRESFSLAELTQDSDPVDNPQE
ncbi:hypothetical protein SteCoe_21615 [Stentor coeruleus]|uniref:TMEM131L fifth Ig-like domain-containing protein n=1 Tax=Stentor coeruleus TaxID=5963 RepID=A0A1R2BP32_9CILI|nr:hypothetical protein SteCoe_21615 [Stentor coeruleus]